MTVIETMPALHPSDVGAEQEKDHDEGPQSLGNDKGMGHREMELEEIEDAQSNEEDKKPPALTRLITVEGGTNDKASGQVHRSVEPSWVWRAGLEELALRRDMEMRNELTDDWWWSIHLKGSSPESEGLQQELFQIREDVIHACDRIRSNYSNCVGNFELEEYDLAKVENGHAEFYQAFRDQDV